MSYIPACTISAMLTTPHFRFACISWNPYTI